jgi:hypothetical protein
VPAHRSNALETSGPGQVVLDLHDLLAFETLERDLETLRPLASRAAWLRASRHYLRNVDDNGGWSGPRVELCRQRRPEIVRHDASVVAYLLTHAFAVTIAREYRQILSADLVCAPQLAGAHIEDNGQRFEPPVVGI